MIQRSPYIRPRRDLPWFRSESRPRGIAAATLGVAGLAVVLAGPLFVLVGNGFTPHETLLEGLLSERMQVILGLGIAIGVAGAVVGWGSYRAMPTRLAREEAIVGGVLGAQAAMLGGFALLFLRIGNLEFFTRNLLDFERLGPQVGAFVNGAKNTVILAAAGEGLGLVGGILLAVFLVSGRRVVRAPARVFVNLFRGTPLLWQLSVGYFGIVLGLRLDVSVYTAAIIVFGLNTAAYAAEVFRAGIQSIERGQLEAARGLGMSYLRAMRHAVLPQAVRRVIPPLTNEFVILVKDTSLVIFLGLSQRQYELMSVGQEGYANSFNATFFVATALGYLAITLPLIRIVNAIERRLRSGLVGASAA